MHGLRELLGGSSRLSHLEEERSQVESRHRQARLFGDRAAVLLLGFRSSAQRAEEVSVLGTNPGKRRLKPQRALIQLFHGGGRARPARVGERKRAKTLGMSGVGANRAFERSRRRGGVPKLLVGDPEEEEGIIPSGVVFEGPVQPGSARRQRAGIVGLGRVDHFSKTLIDRGLGSRPSIGRSSLRLTGGPVGSFPATRIQWSVNVPWGTVRSCTLGMWHVTQSAVAACAAREVRATSRWSTARE
jgi:hypothetical protein